MLRGKGRSPARSLDKSKNSRVARHSKSKVRCVNKIAL